MQIHTPGYLLSLLLLTACPGAEPSIDAGAGGSSGRGGSSGTGGSGGSLGTGGSMGAVDAGPGLTGSFRLSLLLEYRDPTLPDGGQGRGFTPPDGGLLASADVNVQFRARDGGYGLGLPWPTEAHVVVQMGPVSLY